MVGSIAFECKTRVAVLNQKNKDLVWSYWDSLEHCPAGALAAELQRFLDPEAVWHGPDPLNDLVGSEAVGEKFWQPMRRSFADLTRQIHLFFGGRSNGRIDGQGDGRMWVCGTGLFHGRFASDYLGIPATGQPVAIRWGEFCCLDDGQIIESFFLLDLVDLMRQAGAHVLPPGRGKDGVYPPPQANDGILRDAQDRQETDYSLDHIRRFIFDGLNAYDQSKLASMGMADFFHPDVRWYGPGGIGACLGFTEFEDLHQRHWLRAFPDRRVQDLDALIAEGHYSGAPGWAGVRATHAGDYLGCPATGRSVAVNGLDFWKRDGDRYVENWVFVDMIHLFRQLGIDLLERQEQS